MKEYFSKVALSIIVSFLFFGSNIHAQSKTLYLQAKTNNFSSFTTSYKSPGKKWLENNKGYTGNPDAGFLCKDIPKPGAIEILAKRKRNSRYFIDGNKASRFYIVKSIGDINYKKNGQWLTIDRRLSPKGKNIFEASHQQEPVGFDIDKKAAYIKTFSGIFYFNNWQLTGKKENTETLLAKADWTNFSAGDDGIKITNIFPGIDAEMIVEKGAIKTNFIIKQNQFPSYEQLIFSDEFNASATADLVYPDGSVNGERQSGVQLNIGNRAVAQIGSAVMYSENPSVKNYQALNYSIEKSSLSLIVDENDLNKQLVNGEIVIDPLVSSIDSLTANNITGSESNCSTAIQTCNYNLQVQTPAKATVTSVAFQFGYTAFAPSAQEDGDFSIGVGNCNSGNYTVDPHGTSITKPGTVSTQGEWADISSLINCFPAASCTTQPVTFTLLFYNTYCGNAVGCSNEYIAAEEAFQILIEGNTLEIDSVNNQSNITATPSSICQGSQSTLTAAAAYGVPPYIYSWSNNAGNTTTVLVSPSATTPYTFTVTDQCANIASANTTVTVLSAPSPATISSNSPVCQGGTINLSTPLITGVTYNWTGPNSFSNNNQNPSIPNSTAAANGLYSLTLTGQDGCTSQPVSTNVIVQSPATPTVTINASAQTICPGGSVTFNASATNGGLSPSYQWMVNGSDAGTNSSVFTSNSLADGDNVSCTLTSNSLCISSANATSNVIQIKWSKNIAPSITIVASSVNICTGTSVTFTATPVNSIDSSYQWQLNGNNVGTNSSAYTTNSLVNGDIISCVLTSNSSCFGTSTASSNLITMLVNPNVTPSVSITASNNDFCSGTSVTFTAIGLNAGTTPSYEWQASGMPTGFNDSTFTTTQAANGDKISCVLTVSSVGCYSSSQVVSNSITMLVKTVPVITITAADTIIMKNDNTMLNAVVSGNYSNLAWSPSAGLSDTTILNPVAAPLATTNYQLTVTATDGCMASQDITIQVFTKIFIPNSFTPNGDGINDIFRVPPGIVFNLTDFCVYNRWGNKIFETNNINNGWNGTYKDNEVPEGTYIYYISGTNPDGKVFIKGTVTLLR